MKIGFFGGTRSVTGANFWIEANGHQFLVDCGLTQGASFCDACNFDPFPYNPKDIKGVFLTHAHEDHCGRLPKLVNDGYIGPIYANAPTRDLTELNLLDSAGLMVYEHKKFKQRLLFQENDVRRTMKQFKIFGKHASFEPAKGVRVSVLDSGHILGSSMYLIEAEGKRVLFTGDLGNSPNPILPELETVTDVDYVVMESVYGDRIHERKDHKRMDDLENAIEQVATQKGVLMIPAFAIERTQELLFELNYLVENKKVPHMPFFVDSPLAISMTKQFIKHQDFLNDAFKQQLTGDPNLFTFPGLTFTETTEQSKAINELEAPKVIVAGSGMSNGGRILHHERRYLSDPNSILLVVGYQTHGSLGRRLQKGEKSVHIYGEEVIVKATVMTLEAYSAHADQEKLAEWTGHFRHSVKRVFLAMGEAEAAETFATLVRDAQLIDAQVPEANQIVQL